MPSYRITDLFTRVRREVRLPVTRVEAGQVEFDDGMRIELPQGQWRVDTQPMLSTMDVYQPPDGWWSEAVRASTLVPIRYKAADGSQVQLTSARTPGKATHALGPRSVSTEVLTLRGEVDARLLGSQQHFMDVTLHYAPELRRVVRFEFKLQGPSWSSSFNRDARELIELVTLE